jgi:hypothetical protein
MELNNLKGSDCPVSPFFADYEQNGRTALGIFTVIKGYSMKQIHPELRHASSFVDNS